MIDLFSVKRQESVPTKSSSKICFGSLFHVILIKRHRPKAMLFLYSRLNGYQEGVVHNVLVSHKACVIVNLGKQSDPFQRMNLQVLKRVRPGQFHQVDILKSSCWLSLLVHLYLSFNSASFQVEDPFNSSSLKSVRHQHKMYGILSTKFDGVDPINAGQKRFWVSFQVLKVTFCDLLFEEVHFSTSHRLDDEVPVVTEEKETPTCATSFTCFEDSILIP